MILDKGKLIEFDSPHVLIQDKNSLFRSLVEASEDSRELLRMLNVDLDEEKQNNQIKKRTAF